MAQTGMLFLLAATFAGAAVQAATGFGFAIIAAPVFLAVIGDKSAIPILIALHIVQCALLVPRVWRQAPLPHLGWLAAGAVIGCPIGLALLDRLPVPALKIALGLVILIFAVLFIVRERLARSVAVTMPNVAAAPLTTLAGFASGLLTSVFVMPGPPLMVYLARERWPRDISRALSLTFFSGCYVAVLALAAISGQFLAASVVAAIWLSPAVLLGTLAGMAVTARLSEAHYRTALLVLMLLSGVGAIASAL